MSFTIYGLRLAGSNLTRYVGFTSTTPELRLRRHYSTARGSYLLYTFYEWLKDNEGQIEAFPIAVAADQDEARETERAIILLCVSLKQPLLNITHVPHHARIASSAESPRKEAA